MIYINPPNSNITGKMIRILFESGAPGVSYFQTKPMLATSLRTASGDFKLIWQERSCAVWILRFFGEGLGYPVLSPFEAGQIDMIFGRPDVDAAASCKWICGPCTPRSSAMFPG